MANSNIVNVFVDNATSNPVTWNISDGTSIVASGSLEGKQCSSAAAVTPGTITGGGGETPNGLIVTVAPK